VGDFPETVVDKAGWTDLRELDQHGEGLSQFEIDFVESLTKLLRAGRMLSESQRAKLEQIREQRL
jgi:hypothetical protein